MRGFWLLLAPFVLLVAAAGACGDDGSTDGSGDGRVEAPATMVLPVETVPVVGEETPTSFEALKAELAERLRGYGVNIGAVPDDVRQQLLDRCGQLEAFVDSGTVEDICSSIDDAIAQGDPGLIDAIVASLSELEAD